MRFLDFVLYFKKREERKKNNMNEENFKLAEKYVTSSYVNQGKEARRVLEKNLRSLLEQVAFCFYYF